MKKELIKGLYYYNKITKPYFYFNTQKLECQQNPIQTCPEMNERAIEIPLIKQLMAYYETHEILEVGNVLKRFGFKEHKVIDLNEKAEGVENIDIMKFKPKQKFSLIISISTLEHIETGNTLKHLKENCLSDNGLIAFTIPVGFNLELEKQILFDKSIKKWFFVRRNKLNRWYQVFQSDINRIKYNYPFANANAIIFGVTQKQ